MRKLFTTLFLILLSLNNVSAKKGLFGKKESINKIQDIEVKGLNGEDLYLAYKTTGHFFLAGLYFSDDGYVIGIKGQSKFNYPLDDAMLKEMQETNQLPSPLPEYNIPWSDYAIGFSGWPIFALLLFRLFSFVKNKGGGRNCRKRQECHFSL